MGNNNPLNNIACLRHIITTLCSNNLYIQADSLMRCFLAQDGNCEVYTVINSSTSGIPGKKRRNYAGGKHALSIFPFHQFYYLRFDFNRIQLVLDRPLLSILLVPFDRKKYTHNQLSLSETKDKKKYFAFLVLLDYAIIR